jgi:DNA modification methylase
MPESVTDRCTKAHEYIFLMSKNARYYYDQEAIRESSTTPIDTKSAQSFKALGGKARENYGTNEDNWEPDGKRNRRSVWTISTKPYSEAHFATFPPDLIRPCILAGSKPGDIVLDPFFGSGTTGEVCNNHERFWIGCELNQNYELLWKRRTRMTSLFLPAVSEAS